MNPPLLGLSLLSLGTALSSTCPRRVDSPLALDLAPLSRSLTLLSSSWNSRASRAPLALLPHRPFALSALTPLHTPMCAVLPLPLTPRRARLSSTAAYSLVSGVPLELHCSWSGSTHGQRLRLQLGRLLGRTCTHTRRGVHPHASRGTPTSHARLLGVQQLIRLEGRLLGLQSLQLAQLLQLTSSRSAGGCHVAAGSPCSSCALSCCSSSRRLVESGRRRPPPPADDASMPDTAVLSRPGVAL